MCCENNALIANGIKIKIAFDKCFVISIQIWNIFNAVKCKGSLLYLTFNLYETILYKKGNECQVYYENNTLKYLWLQTE